LRDNEHGGRARILKLKDWPTKKDFASVFPTRLHDLMNHIPFSKEILLFSSKLYLFLIQVITLDDHIHIMVLHIMVEFLILLNVYQLV